MIGLSERLEKDPSGFVTRGFHKTIIGPIKYGRPDGYDAERYWRDRFSFKGLDRLILTHNYPTRESPNSGIWIKRLWGDKPVMLVGKLKGFLKAVRELRSGSGTIIAYWMFPAGLLAYLCGRPYILNCVGLDIFMICPSRILSFLFRPVLNKADKLVFIGGHPKNVFERRYGDRYKSKSHLIYLPVDGREFS